MTLGISESDRWVAPLRETTSLSGNVYSACETVHIYFWSEYAYKTLLNLYGDVEETLT